MELPRAPALSDGSWDLLVAPFLYDTPIDYCVRALKFHGETAFGRLLGLLVAHLGAAQERIFECGIDLPHRLCGRALGVSVLVAFGHGRSLSCLGAW